MSTGTCTTHSWNDGAEDDEGDPKMGLRVDERLQIDDELYDDSRLRNRESIGSRTRLRSRRIAADGEDGTPSPW